MEIRKVFKEEVPKSKLVGKLYTEQDILNYSFGHKWGEFFRNGWFEKLTEAGGKLEFDYIAMMRVYNGQSQYWIGMLFDENAVVPQSFDTVDIEKFQSAVFWIYGNSDNGEIYGMDVHNKCVELLQQHGWKGKKDSWCIERYNCPRFTSPDEKGNVVLDYYIAIE